MVDHIVPLCLHSADLCALCECVIEMCNHLDDIPTVCDHSVCECVKLMLSEGSPGEGEEFC